MIEFVEVDVDGDRLRVGLTVQQDASAHHATARWTATAQLPLWTTPRASISIRGVGRDRTSAVGDALTKVSEAIERFESSRRQSPQRPTTA
jgi:hypothetical protein